MTRPSKTGGKASATKTRKASSIRGRKPNRTKRRRNATTAAPLKRSNLGKELKEAREQQAATAEILKVIASSPGDVQPVFEAIAESAKRLLGSYHAVVTRVIDDTVHLAAFTAGGEEGDKALQSRFPMPLSGPGPNSRAARTGEIELVTDTETYLDISEDFKKAARARGFRSVLVVPMLRNGVAIGTIATSRRQPGSFAEEEIDLLRTFADQAVIAIENTRLFNETKEALERQTATAAILKVIASSPSDLQPVFEAIATSANRLLGGFSCTVSRFIDGAAHLEAFTPRNPAADEMLKAVFPRPVADFAPFEMTQAGEVVQIPDTEARSDPIQDFARARGFRAMLFAPLMNKGISIGVIAVTRVQPGIFADHHVQLLKAFADQAVIAIENTRLFNETKEALERQTATADILKVIASSPSDVQPVFDAIAMSAKRLLGGFSSTVFRFFDGMAHLKAFTPTTPDADEILQSTFPRPVADVTAFRMAQSGDVMQIPDTQDTTYELSNIARARGYRSMLFAPLMHKGASIGFIAVTRVQPGAFADHHVQLLKTFADQAVIAIENARLFDEVQAKTQDLEESLQQQTATSSAPDH